MRKKAMALTVAAVVGLTSLVPNVANAVTNSEIQAKRKQINQIQSKQSSVESQINQQQKEIERLQAEQDKLATEIKKLDLAVAETSGKIRVKSQKIEETKQAIETLKKEIVEVEERITKRNELLKQRVRSLQESGGVISYLDVLLGAQSFSDFIDRISAVTTIFEADKQIIKEQEADKALKEQKERELSASLAQLENDLQDLKQLKQELKNQISEKDQLMATLEQQEHEHHEARLALEEEKALLEKQEAAMRTHLQQLIEKQKEEAGRRTSQQSGNSSGSNLPPVTSGAFMRPANGPVTSEFGPRWGEYHYGIDIGKRGTDVPVVAVADGYVFRSYYSSSYGNVIFISHVVNGQYYTSVYAHLESRLVGEGQTVSKGQMIGYMGNTGWSTGPHLHFELHKGPWTPSKSNAVNPRNYIDF